MSLYYVNDHLIEEEVGDENSWPQNNNETYKRIMIRTTSQAVKRQEDGTFINGSRPICAHNCSLIPSAKTRISSTISETGRVPKVTVRTSSDTRYNSDIFIVALPYDGMVKPFTHDEKALAIYKSVILKSDKYSIEHNDKKYKRVAYFVVRPNFQHLGEDGWYGEECDLVVTFAQSDKSRRDQSEEECHWTFKTVTVHFGADGAFDINSTEEVAPYDSFNPEDLHGQPICNLVQPTVLSDNGGGRYNR
jgi:hypothetical protein